MADKRQFRTELERGGQALGWTVARVPFSPREAWPGMIRLRVRGTVNGFAFRTSLFPYAEEQGGGYSVLVNRAMQRGSGTAAGVTANFELEPDLEERTAELPDVLDALLDEAPGLRAWYGELSEYTRREIGKWVEGVKTDEARGRRAEQTAERMLSTMEAEVELPPAIARRLTGKALTGWRAMTPAKRRAELFAVFHYRTPESRDKRIAKLVETASMQASKAEK